MKNEDKISFGGETPRGMDPDTLKAFADNFAFTPIGNNRFILDMKP